MEMKITPAKNYKKPLYAAGIAATLVAVSVTGCTDLSIGAKSGTKGAGKGPVQVNTVKKDADSEPIYEGEIDLAGEVELDGDVALEGEVAYEPDPTEEYPDNVGPELSGSVEVEDH